MSSVLLLLLFSRGGGFSVEGPSYCPRPFTLAHLHRHANARAATPAVPKP